MAFLIIQQRDHIDDDCVQGAEGGAEYRGGNAQQGIHDQDVAAGGEYAAQQGDQGKGFWAFGYLGEVLAAHLHD